MSTLKSIALMIAVLVMAFGQRILRAFGFRPQLSPLAQRRLNAFALWRDRYGLSLVPFKLGGAALAPIAGADDGTATLNDTIDQLQGALVERIKSMTDPNGEDKQEIERREKELADLVDQLKVLGEGKDSQAVADFKSEMGERFERFEKQMRDWGLAPAEGAQGAGVVPESPEVKAHKARYLDGDLAANIFLDMKEATKDHTVADRIREYEGKHAGPDRLKLWATGSLETVDLILPEVQDALPFLAAAAKVTNLCREIRVGSPAVEFPVFASGLTVDVVAEGATKPDSTPTWTLQTARVYTVAGTTQVPNQTLEDFPAARGWISTELGRATGVKEDQLVLSGTGTGQPLGFLNNGAITGRAVAGQTGRNYIEALFRAAQDVRANGFTAPSDIVAHPRFWTDVVLSFEANVGYLYGPASGGGLTSEQPTNGPNAGVSPRLLGLPVTESAYLPTNLGAGTNETVALVGDFNDAIVLRRSPFRVDVDTSLGFRDNTTWFRGEERVGFIVVRPASFKKVTGAIPTT